MEAYQKRVVEEKSQLEEELGKLRSFLYRDKFPTLEKEDQELLLRQEGVMTEYVKILTERIFRF